MTFRIYVAEALTEGSAGGLLSSEITSSRVPTTWSGGEGNTCCSVNASYRTARRSLRTWHVRISFTRESGDPRFFFGSDSAPHRIVDKEKAGGAGGVFNIATALPAVVQVFEAEASMENLEAFMSLNGARFYGLPINPDTITLKKAESPIAAAEYIPAGGDRVKVFQTQEPLYWRVVDGLRQTN